MKINIFNAYSETVFNTLIVCVFMLCGMLSCNTCVLERNRHNELIKKMNIEVLELQLEHKDCHEEDTTED